MPHRVIIVKNANVKQTAGSKKEDRMIKFKDENGKVVLVLFDEGTKPEEIETVRKKLNDMGVLIEGDDKEKIDLQLSQDDLAWVKGDA